LVVDLKRGVLDVEVVVEQRVHGPSGGVAVGVGVDQDVRGQGRESGGDFPDVEVVDLDDAGLAGELLVRFGRVDASGAASRKIRAEAFTERVAGADHEPGDQQRDDRVGALEAGGEDHDGGDRGADERVEVGQDVLVGPFDVEALAVGFRERPGRDQSPCEWP
jgi:hypothetical protein